jgi:hypothetical protein
MLECIPPVLRRVENSVTASVRRLVNAEGPEITRVVVSVRTRLGVRLQSTWRSDIVPFHDAYRECNSIQKSHKLLFAGPEPSQNQWLTVVSHRSKGQLKRACGPHTFFSRDAGKVYHSGTIVGRRSGGWDLYVPRLPFVAYCTRTFAVWVLIPKTRWPS